MPRPVKCWNCGGLKLNQGEDKHAALWVHLDDAQGEACDIEVDELRVLQQRWYLNDEGNQILDTILPNKPALGLFVRHPSDNALRVRGQR